MAAMGNKQTYLSFFFYCLILLLNTISTTIVKNVVRPDYGVVFQRKADLYVASGKWTHSFIIPFPEMAKYDTNHIECPDTGLLRGYTQVGTAIAHLNNAERIKHKREDFAESLSRYDWGRMDPYLTERVLNNTYSLADTDASMREMSRQLSHRRRIDRRGKRFISAAICNQFQALITDMKLQYDHVLSLINDTHVTMNNLINYRADESSSHTPSRSRSKKSVLGYLEREYHIIGNYMGFASQEETAELRAHIKDLETWASNTSDSVNGFKDKTSSYMSIANLRLTQAVEQIDVNMGEVNRLWHEFAIVRTGLENNRQHIGSVWHAIDTLILYMTGAFKNQILVNQALASLSIELAQHMASIQTLIQGHLPIQLVPASAMERALLAIEVKLRLYFPQFMLATRSVASFYGRSGVIFAKSRENIIITVDIPLIAHRSSKFNTYQIRSIPITIDPHLSNNNGIRSATKFNTEYKYFAVSSDQRAYLSLTSDQYDGCNYHESRTFCTEMFPLVDMAKPSCLKALFFGNNLEIDQLCTFEYFPNFQGGPQYIDLGAGRIMLSNVITKWTKICGEEYPIQVDVCTSCVFALNSTKCGYKIGDQFYLPPRFLGRGSSKIVRKIVPIRNAAFNNQFYAKLKSTTKFSAYHGRDIADLLIRFNKKVDDQNRKKFLADDKKLSFQLTELVEEINNIEIPVLSSAEWLEESMLYAFGPFTRIFFFIIVGVGAIAGPVALLVTFCLYRRLAHMQAIIVLARMTRPTMAFDTIDTNSSNIIDDDHSYVIYFSISLTLGILFLGIMLSCIKRHTLKIKARLMISLRSNDDMSIDLMLRYMKPAIGTPQLLSNSNLTDVGLLHVQGWDTDKIYLGTFEIDFINDLELYSIRIPEYIYVTRKQLDDVRKLFLSPVKVSMIYYEYDEDIVNVKMYPEVLV